MKNLRNNTLSFIITLTGFTSSIDVYAKLYVPQSEDQFYRELERHNLAVVHFNPYPVESAEFQLERMKDAFGALSQSDRFKDADVAFIGVNLHVVPELVDDFNLELSPIVNGDQDLEDEGDQEATKEEKKDDLEIKHISEIKPEEQAIVMLFKNGKPLTDGGKKVMHAGFMSKIEMQDFINKYFGSSIDQRLAQKKEQERERLNVRYVERPKRELVQKVYYTTPRYQYYHAPSWRRWGYYGYPYGYWPGFGIGFGFGGRRGGFSFGFGW